jgi:hypothetical protein
MTTTHCGHDHEPRGGFDDLGRAAERFARRVARDASKFAERLSEHAGEFAHDAARDWRRWSRAADCGPTTGADARRVFEDIRGVLNDLAEGVDELIERVFREPAETTWTRVVANRPATCGACAREVGAGEEIWVRRAAGAREFRCVACGVAPPAGDA